MACVLALWPRIGTAEQRIAVDQAPLEKPAAITWTDAEKAFTESPAGRELFAALDGFFQASPEQRANFSFAGQLDAQVKERPAIVRKMAWVAYRRGWESKTSQQDLAAFQVTWKKLTMPYVVRQIGKRPPGGWPLFIAMHGGGGATKQINDQQWLVMMNHYRPHPELGGYLYCVPRAPNDAWNGFYTDYNIPMFEQLIRQLQFAADIDPNKVYLMGVSHGGYGTYYLGMKLADRVAGAHAAAADPPGNWRDCANLRNTYFSAMVGERDTRHGRVNGVKGFGEGRTKSQALDPQTFRGPTVIVPGRGHTGMPDRDVITKLYAEVRTPLPRRITWAPDRLVRSFYWLHSPELKEGEVDAARDGNAITLSTKGLTSLVLYLDERLVDLQKPVTVKADGRESTHKLTPSLRTLCETLAERGDPEYIFTVRVPVAVGAVAKQSTEKSP